MVFQCYFSQYSYIRLYHTILMLRRRGCLDHWISAFKSWPSWGVVFLPTFQLARKRCDDWDPQRGPFFTAWRNPSAWAQQQNQRHLRKYELIGWTYILCGAQPEPPISESLCFSCPAFDLFICDHARARSTNSEAFLVCPVVALSSHNLRATGKQWPDKELPWGVAYFMKHRSITRIQYHQIFSLRLHFCNLLDHKLRPETYPIQTYAIL